MSIAKTKSQNPPAPSNLKDRPWQQSTTELSHLTGISAQQIDYYASAKGLPHAIALRRGKGVRLIDPFDLVTFLTTVAAGIHQWKPVLIALPRCRFHAELQVRGGQSQAHVDRLAEAFRMGKQIEPIYVILRDGWYYVLAGHHRVKGGLQAKAKQIFAYILPAGFEKLMHWIAIRSNSRNGSEIGKPSAYIRRVFALDPRLGKAALAGEISTRSLAVLLGLGDHSTVVRTLHKIRQESADAAPASETSQGPEDAASEHLTEAIGALRKLKPRALGIERIRALAKVRRTVTEQLCAILETTPEDLDAAIAAAEAGGLEGEPSVSKQHSDPNVCPPVAPKPEIPTIEGLAGGCGDRKKPS